VVQGTPVATAKLPGGLYDAPGYDEAQRARPYPTLYLSHGGGGNEMDLEHLGDAADIPGQPDQ